MTYNKKYIDSVEYDLIETRKRMWMMERKKNEELLKKYQQAMSDLEDYKNLYMRQRSEMENYQRYIEKTINNIKANANADLIKTMLPVLDSLDAGILHDEKLKPIRSQLIKILSNYGLKEIESRGKKFDPYLNEVVGIVKGDDDIVVEEVQKGYILNNEVLRTSKVIVSKGGNNEQDNRN
ncbi:nucleotide exchange factor GrpE [Picrophilus oshimae]|nr:nucleotide exchange factor GrpE [Picrophilus oshimae]